MYLDLLQLGINGQWFAEQGKRIVIESQRHKACRAAISRAMVRMRQIVVDGFGHADSKPIQVILFYFNQRCVIMYTPADTIKCSSIKTRGGDRRSRNV
jgi:hypothetical protein